MKKPVRLFIAVKISEKQKHELTSLQNKLKNHLEGVRWVRPEGLHLTLKFIGETEEDAIASIKQAMDLTVPSIAAFKMKFGGCGAFPSPQKARIIWVGLIQGLSEMKRLAEDLQDNLSVYGFAPEKRPYQPHITLGRLRYSLPEIITTKILEEEDTFLSSVSDVDCMTLFTSQLLPRGALYTEIYQASLMA